MKKMIVSESLFAAFFVAILFENRIKNFYYVHPNPKANFVIFPIFSSNCLLSKSQPDSTIRKKNAVIGQL